MAFFYYYMLEREKTPMDFIKKNNFVLNFFHLVCKMVELGTLDPYFIF